MQGESFNYVYGFLTWVVGGLGRVAHIFEHPSAKREDENKVAQVGEAPRDGHPSAKRED